MRKDKGLLGKDSCLSGSSLVVRGKLPATDPSVSPSAERAPRRLGCARTDCLRVQTLPAPSFPPPAPHEGQNIVNSMNLSTPPGPGRLRIPAKRSLILQLLTWWRTPGEGSGQRTEGRRAAVGEAGRGGANARGRSNATQFRLSAGKIRRAPGGQGHARSAWAHRNHRSPLVLKATSETRPSGSRDTTSLFW